MLSNEEVKKNIEEVKNKIGEICRACGRADRPVLLAATKTVPVEQINFAIRECGITAVGENRVQELLEKYDALDRSARLHFIGRLQRNKVKYIADKVDVIESLDSLPLAEEIEKQAAKKGRIIEVYLEVNTGREPQKGGFFPEDLDAALDEISRLPHLRVKGLMAVSPVTDQKDEILRYFTETYQKFIDISGKKLHNIDMSVLSMGMTDSYAEAIAAGSTEIRLGSALFGRRDYPPAPGTDASSPA